MCLGFRVSGKGNPESRTASTARHLAQRATPTKKTEVLRRQRGLRNQRSPTQNDSKKNRGHYFHMCHTSIRDLFIQKTVENYSNTFRIFMNIL